MTASCNIVLLMHVQSMMLTSTCPVRPCIWSVLGIWSKPCSAVSITAAFRHHGHELLTDSSSHKFPMLSCTIKSYAVLADMPSMVSSSPCPTSSKAPHRCGLSDAIVIPSTPAPCAVSMGSLYTSVPKQSGIHCQCR